MECSESEISKSWGRTNLNDGDDIKLNMGKGETRDENRGTIHGMYYLLGITGHRDGQPFKSLQPYQATFDETARGTSFMTDDEHSGYAIEMLQGDALCVPYFLKELKEKMKTEKRAVKNLIVDHMDEQSAIMLGKFIADWDIGCIRLEISSEYAENGDHHQRFINELPQSSRVEIIFNITRDIVSEKYPSWAFWASAARNTFGEFFSRNYYGFDVGNLREFISRIKPLDTLWIELKDLRNTDRNDKPLEHTHCSLVTDQWMMQLCRTHNHIRVGNVLETQAQCELLCKMASELKNSQPRIWRSCQVRITVEALEKVIAEYVTVKRQHYDLVYEAKNGAHYIQVDNTHCLFYPKEQNLAFFISPVYEVEDARHITSKRKLDVVELRLERNYDESTHWALLNHKNAKKKSGW